MVALNIKHMIKRDASNALVLHPRYNKIPKMRLNRLMPINRMEHQNSILSVFTPGPSSLRSRLPERSSLSNPAIKDRK